MKVMKCAVIMAIAIFLIAGAAEGQIQPSFFGMGAIQGSDLPKVSYGTLSHPPLAWTAIESGGRGVYDFSSTDAFVKGAPKDQYGVAQIDLVMGWTPGWAVAVKTHCVQHNGMEICMVPPDNMQDWTDFITALAAHYNGKLAPQVKYYEIWNEANTPSFWAGTEAQLVAMAKIAYPIFKKNVRSQVLTPSVTWTPGGTTFIAKYLSGGGSAYADGVSFHGYPSKTGRGIKIPIPLPESPLSTNAPLQTMVTSFRAVADANGMKGKPLVTTEGGWGVGGVTDSDLQAAWIAQYEILQASLAATNNLAFQTWFTWGQASSGTIENGQGNPTEAGLAYQEVMAWIVGSTATPCTSKGTIWSCVVGANMIVWDESQTCSNGVCTTGPYNAPQGYLKYVDLAGVVHPITGTIALGVKPILMQP